ncbi:hypothetical protein D3C85_1806510 [compost metagenome]
MALLGRVSGAWRSCDNNPSRGRINLYPLDVQGESVPVICMYIADRNFRGNRGRIAAIVRNAWLIPRRRNQYAIAN